MRLSYLLSFLLCFAVFSGEAAAARSSSSSTMTYKGVTYKSSSSSKCADGSSALRYQSKYWCPVTTTTASSGSTTSGSTSGSGTTTTTPVTQTAQLTWTIPTTRADGTALAVSELAGYEVYYTNDSGSVSVTLSVSGASTVSTTVASLTTGNYYFSISAVDSTGLKSALSSVVTYTVP